MNHTKMLNDDDKQLEMYCGLTEEESAEYELLIELCQNRTRWFGQQSFDRLMELFSYQFTKREI